MVLRLSEPQVASRHDTAGSNGRKERPLEEQPPRWLQVLGASRYFILVAVVAIFAGATALLAFGAWETVHLLQDFARAALERNGDKALIVGLIELTDHFLLATALYVIAIGLFELFVDARLSVPAWLEIRDLNDLKEKLIGVLVVMMAVLFLGHVATWNGQQNLLGFGAAIALVIVALAWFVGQKPKK
jgi:uncharacterized membrane protein YqhA